MTLLRQGLYKLIETKIQTKILYLDKNIYEVTQTDNSGQIVTATHAIDKSDNILGIGIYRLSQPDDRPNESCLRLELEQGAGSWQTYDLMGPLPDGKTGCTSFIANDKSADIVPLAAPTTAGLPA